MKNTGIYVGVDIGTTSIRVIVAEAVDGQLNVIGLGSADSAGVKRGVIVDIDQTVLALKEAVGQAQKNASIEINEVYLGIPANLLEIRPCQGMISIPEKNGKASEINDTDVLNVAKEAVRQTLSSDREIIDLVPREFTVDGFDSIVDPRGMLGLRLEMKGVMYTGPKTVLHNTFKCAQRAGLRVAGCVVAPLAVCDVALQDDQKDFGGIVIDLGGGQTTAAVMHNHQLRFSYVDQEGGNYVGKDISMVLNTSVENAENIKRSYGSAMASLANPDEAFPVSVVGQQEPKHYSEEYLAEIIEARIRQIFTKVKAQLDSVNALSLPGGVVLTGGLAAMPHIVELASDVFDVPVSYYFPEEMGIRHPIFSEVLGIVDHVASTSEINALVKSVLPAQAGQQPEETPVQPAAPTPRVANQPEKHTEVKSSVAKKDETKSSGQKGGFNKLLHKLRDSFFD